MKTLRQILRFLSGRVDRQTPRSDGVMISKAELRQRVGTARAQAEAYEALGWR